MAPQLWWICSILSILFDYWPQSYSGPHNVGISCLSMGRRHACKSPRRVWGIARKFVLWCRFTTRLVTASEQRSILLPDSDGEAVLRAWDALQHDKVPLPGRHVCITLVVPCQKYRPLFACGYKSCCKATPQHKLASDSLCCCG